MEARIDEYLSMGVKAVWLIDPRAGGFLCAGGNPQHWTPAITFRLESTPIFLDLAGLFADLN